MFSVLETSRHAGTAAVDTMVTAESPAVGAVVILDRDGERIAGSYFDDQFRTLALQQVRQARGTSGTRGRAHAGVRVRVVYVVVKVPAPGCICGGCTVSPFASCPHTRAIYSRAGS